MNANDVMLIISDVLLLSLFGTALSSVVNNYLKSQGQITAVGTMISAGYGFLCGAYMPISSFNSTLQKVLSFLPGTYAASILRNHSLDAPLKELIKIKLPTEIVENLKKALDCKITFFDNTVTLGTMYAIMASFIVALTISFILMSRFRKRK